MTIYLLTAGEYSDYQVLGAFTDRAAAEAARDSYNDTDDKDKAGLEEYEANAIADHRWQEVWWCTIREDGSSFGGKQGPSFLPSRFSEIRMHPYQGCLATARSTVSQEHADKLAIEARQEWLRERATPEPTS